MNTTDFWYKPPLMTSLATSLGRRYAAQIPDLLKHKGSRLQRKLTKKIKTKLQLNK